MEADRSVTLGSEAGGRGRDANPIGNGELGKRARPSGGEGDCAAVAEMQSREEGKHPRKERKGKEK